MNSVGLTPKPFCFYQHMGQAWFRPFLKYYAPLLSLLSLGDHWARSTVIPFFFFLPSNKQKCQFSTTSRPIKLPGKPSPKLIFLILIQEVRFCSKVGDLERATYRSFYRIRNQTACQWAWFTFQGLTPSLMKKNYILDKLFRWISSQQQGAGSKLQVTTFMERKCEPVPNFSIVN